MAVTAISSQQSAISRSCGSCSTQTSIRNLKDNASSFALDSALLLRAESRWLIAIPPLKKENNHEC